MISDYFYKCPGLRFSVIRTCIIPLCILLFTALVSPLHSFAQPIGATINNPIVMGTYAGGSYNYTDTKNNSTSNGYQNNYGQASDDIYYRFTVQGSTQIDISHCSSGFDTYLHLLNSSGTVITYNDDYGPLCNTNRASISTTLAAGTYYIVSEGYGSLTGNITTSVALVVQPPVLPLGATINNPIIIGTYSAGSYNYSDTRNNNPANGYANDFGQSSDDIYYKFTIQNTAQADISHCGSGWDTYIHLLNSDGSLNSSNDDGGPVCAGTSASMRLTLAPGTYYIVSEGYGSSYGNITTSMSLVVQSPPPPDDNIRSVNGNYSFPYNTMPENLVSLTSDPAGATFQWEKSPTAFDGFTEIAGATSATYTFPAVLTQTTYYRRKVIYPNASVYSNILKIEVVSVIAENINYVREHDILVQGVTDWQVIDNLPIGDKLQTTTYMDGLGRPIQKVSREMAVPQSGSLWGDVVQFSEYDIYGRQPRQHLPYTTISQSGKYKTLPFIEQPQYYLSALNETFSYSTSTFDNSPLSRVVNVKSSGTSWNTVSALGNSISYQLNGTEDNVQIFTIGYNPGDIPLNAGAYNPNTLFKTVKIDENNKQVIEYTDISGQVILTKTQIDQNPSAAHSGWICVYSVYDDFGLLRFRLQPEAVKYLSNNGWSFAGTYGQQVLNELCFRYEYDDKGRNIVKKAPGAKELRMIYDDRDRVRFMQDGNQSVKSTPEWIFNSYDELDRVTTTSLYSTTKSVAQLQDDLASPPQLAFIAAASTKLKYLFYDDYSYAGAKSFDNVFDNTTAYSNSEANVIPIAPSSRTLSFPTGSMVRVLGTSTFLSSTEYYDEKGRHIQTLEDNIKSGSDVTTLQYHWDGRLLSTHSKHSTANTGYSNFSTLTKNIFDKIGRVTSLQKKYGSNNFKTVATYALDDMGRLKNKTLAPIFVPGVGFSRVESLTYTYNIHNNITGINKDYALKGSGYDKWNNYFGLYLGYDNRDNVFTTGQLDGHVTGLLWNTMGDDAQRKYDYTYDNAGRLTKADFREKKTTADAWDNTKMDFTVTGSNGKIEYDLNGNLQSMIHKGVVIGNNTPLNVDAMSYTYAQYSNKLVKVTDNGNAGAANGKLGDFADGTNGADDYVYDDNGNLIIDLNKNAANVTGGVTTAIGTSGIKYNYLDKPEEIRISGKGLIQIVYDADGNKLQKKYTPENTTNTTITTYINEFVYTGDALQYINFEEGRIRVITPVSQSNAFDALVVDGNMDLPNAKEGAYDFFIRDYQQNVRMILTEEVHTGYNTCTMESERSGAEEPIFGQAGTNNEVVQTRNTKPTGWSSNTSTSVSKLSAAGKKAGPNVLLKVMAGDQISATTKYYYQNAVTNSTGNNLTTDVLTTLISSILGSNNTGLAKGNTTNISNDLGLNGSFTSITSPDANNSNGTNPKAYMTIMFFDERFNFVSEGSTALRVSQQGDNASPLVLANIKSPKNGYAYVYLSNESNEPVYFDNFVVGDNRGRIIEEDHYYAFGLKIAAISSKKLGDGNEGHLQNNYLYQGDFSEFDENLGWNDFALRNYDPQIGKWIQQDPYNEFHSPYSGMGNDPVLNIDPSGGSIATGLGILKGMSPLGRAGVMALGGAIIGAAIDLETGGEGFSGALFGAGLGLAANLNFGSFVAEAAKGLGGFFQQNPNFKLQKTKEYFYKSKDAAAIGWGQQYNSPSIQNNAEVAGVVFSVRVKSKTWYSYNTPKVGGKATSNFNRIIPKKTVKVALIHSHGGFEDPKEDNHFSNDDIDRQYLEEVDSYISTPDGKLRVIREGRNYPDKYGDLICNCMSADARYQNQINPKTRGKVFLDNFEYGADHDINPYSIPFELEY